MLCCADPIVPCASEMTAQLDVLLQEQQKLQETLAAKVCDTQATGPML